MFVNRKDNFAFLTFENAFKCNADSAIDTISELKEWFFKYRHLLSQRAMNDLLRILRITFPELCLNSRSFLKTPSFCPYDIISVSPGLYYHIGIEAGLRNKINEIKQNTFLESDNEVVLPVNINIDGIPISNSSRSQLWPILVAIDVATFDTNARKPFAAGIYHGNTKPASADEFLKKFIEEFLYLQENGFKIKNKVVKIKVNKILCDASAKLFVLSIKGHNGHFSCTKCVQEGTFINRRMAFLEEDCELRTDESFKLQVDEKFHKGTSPFTKLDVGLVS
ncbi:uncharacterized protein [Linepithema humile]|uniref:uncharacterized protein n=1 Tax=Linepithema humile TaxID=83485 RepID=UPI000623B02F|nr:PREDICTED: uncharacterized protein LOC105679103 [Linepithema humile]